MWLVRRRGRRREREFIRLIWGGDEHSNFANYGILFDCAIALPATSSLWVKNKKSSFLSVDSEKGNGELVMWLFRRRGRRREREFIRLIRGVISSLTSPIIGSFLIVQLPRLARSLQQENQAIRV
jgi:hypothetical protein